LTTIEIADSSKDIPMRILIIEAEEELAHTFKEHLKHAGYVVDVTADGEEGSYVARTNAYDLVTLDTALPKQDGMSVLKEIRINGKTMPIIILSVVSAPQTKVAFLRAGADDYMTKPCNFDEFLARIEVLLRRPPHIADDILRLDDLTLDKTRHIVRRGAESIPLRLKEFLILEYLLRNPGVVMTRSMIMEQVWERDHDPFSTTVEAHMSTLRSKIDTKGKKKLLHTIIGRGYKLDDTGDA